MNLNTDLKAMKNMNELKIKSIVHSNKEKLKLLHAFKSYTNEYLEKYPNKIEILQQNPWYWISRQG